jgi:hypothetical protein
MRPPSDAAAVRLLLPDDCIINKKVGGVWIAGWVGFGAESLTRPWCMGTGGLAALRLADAGYGRGSR